MGGYESNRGTHIYCYFNQAYSGTTKRTQGHMNKKELGKLLKEKQRRSRIKDYEHDFTRFAEEQIQIVTKDVATRVCSI